MCAKNYTDVDDGRIVECQSCKHWYHCSCFTLLATPPGMTGKQVRFKCGRKTCKNRESDINQKGYVDCSTSIAQDLNCVEQSNTKFVLKINGEFSGKSQCFKSKDSFQYKNSPKISLDVFQSQTALMLKTKLGRDFKIKKDNRKRCAYGPQEFVCCTHRIQVHRRFYKAI